MLKSLICASFLLLMAPVVLRAQGPYYQGKTMTIIVGTVAGDLYDLYARREIPTSSCKICRARAT
jgi:hypothetical protein